MKANTSLAETKNDQAREYYRFQQYSNAMYYYTMAINLCPTVAKYYANRASCFIMMKEYNKAQADAQKSIELDSKYLNGYTRTVTCCLVTGNLQHAEKTLSTAKEIFPNNEQILASWDIVKYLQENHDQFRLKMGLKKYEEALRFIEICIEKEPRCQIYILNKAKCLIYLQRYTEAEKIADAYLKFKPTDEDAMYIKTCSICYRGEVENAMNLVKELKVKLPDNAETSQLYQNTKTICKNLLEINKLINASRFEEAYILLTKTIKMNEHYSITNKKLYLKKIEIVIKEDNKLFWDGISDCTEYLRIFGSDLNVLKSRTEFYMKLEEYEDAVLDYKELVKLEGTDENQCKLKEVEKLLSEQLMDDFKLLKINRKATKEQIRQAAMSLKIKYHPDKNRNQTPEKIKLLEKKFDRVRRAESILLKK